MRVHHSRPTYSQTLAGALDGHMGSIALIDGDERLTYAELKRRVTQVANDLHRLGLRPGDGVAQLSTNVATAVIVQLAAYALGVRYTPLHPMGAVSDHTYIIDDSGAQALIFEARKFERHAKALSERCSALRIVLSHRACDSARSLDEIASPNPQLTLAELAARATPDDIAALLYTGGTTGRPKGVALSSWAMVLNTLLTLSGWEWPQEIRFLCTTPITHATGCMLVPILNRGGSIILQQAFDADKFLEAISRHRVTATFLVPTMIYSLTEAQRDRPRDLSSLQTVIYGGAPITRSGLEAALAVFGPVFMQIYSQSEAPCCATVLKKAEHTPQRLGSCGRPLAGISVRLLGENDSSPIEGEAAEVCFQGPSLMNGYWNKPEESAEALENGWLRTGDVAQVDQDGFLYIVDRRKEMIVTGGFNIYPREIEETLSGHPSVKAVAVIGVPDRKWGEAVKAIIVAHPGEHPSERELIDFVKQHKGSVSAPKSIDFLPELPLTELGKVDKKALRAKYWSSHERQVN